MRKYKRRTSHGRLYLRLSPPPYGRPKAGRVERTLPGALRPLRETVGTAVAALSGTLSTRDSDLVRRELLLRSDRHNDWAEYLEFGRVEH
jgi:hypothetical protein